MSRNTTGAKKLVKKPRAALPDEIGLKVSLKKYRLILSSLRDLPFTVYQHPMLAVSGKLSDIVYKQPNGTDAVITDDTQLSMWKDCVLTCADPGGWTLFIGTGSSIDSADYMAAYLAARTIDNGHHALWIDISRAAGRGHYTIEDITNSQPPGSRLAAGPTRLAVITGLRFDGYGSKWERAFDILRTTPPNMNRVVVACGCDPIQASLKLGLSAQRAVYLTARPQLHNLG